MLSEGGGVEMEWGGVNSDVSGSTVVGGGVSRKGSWVPLAVGTGLCVVTSTHDPVGGSRVKRGSTPAGAGLDKRLSGTESKDFSTKRHCMMLVSLPPVEIR